MTETSIETAEKKIRKPRVMKLSTELKRLTNLNVKLGVKLDKLTEKRKEVAAQIVSMREASLKAIEEKAEQEKAALLESVPAAA